MKMSDGANVTYVQLTLMYVIKKYLQTFIPPIPSSSSFFLYIHCFPKFKVYRYVNLIHAVFQLAKEAKAFKNQNFLKFQK